MPYTVKQLGKISGVSVRTLHWYDEIGLLQPAYHGSNGYRYYEEEQLLLLQQILFFRELGFSLNDIQKVILSDDFNKIRALVAHKKTLEESLDRTKKLIDTVDKTILHMRGTKKMKDEDFYAGFDAAKQKEYEKYLVKYRGTIAEDLIKESKRRTKEWDKKDWDSIKKEGNAIYKKVAQLIDEGFEPRSEEVQKEVHKHYLMINRFYTASKDVYVGLSQLYCEHPDFRKFFDPFHPKLMEFFAEAMRVYAHQNLS